MANRLVVLFSGNGGNLQAIMDACQNGNINASIAAVFCDKGNAYGLKRAETANIPAFYVPKYKEQSRQTYDLALAEKIIAYKPDWVILAGWMRLLSACFLDQFPGKVINLHPALPGTFPGNHAIGMAFQAFHEKKIAYTGVMVHTVPDEGVDCGPLLAQEIVPITDQDSLETLEQRIHLVEHRLLVQVLHGLCKPNE